MSRLYAGTDYPCDNITHRVFYIGEPNNSPTEEERCLLDAALSKKKQLLESNRNLESVILAQAKKDSENKEWNALIYSPRPNGDTL